MKTTDAIKIKLTHCVDELTAEAERFKGLAKDHLFHAHHRGDVNALDERRIRDHEIRAETYRAAAIINRKS